MPRILLAVAFALVSPSAAHPADESYRIDPAASDVTIAVGKTGIFSFAAGHTHEVTGPVTGGEVEWDGSHPERSRVRLEIATASLKVSRRNEPPDDVPKVQERMQSDEVLGVTRHPAISFESTSVSLAGGQPPAMDLVVDGRLTIRDVARPITVPVHVDLAGGALRVAGRFSIRQTAFGIKPVSIGGVVAVKDALDIRFSVVARR